MYAVHVRKPGGTCIFEGSLTDCQTLVMAMKLFPQDIIRVELLDNDCNVVEKWVSPYWA